MTRPGSLFQRNRAVRNLRAAPSWLTAHRVDRILAVLDRPMPEAAAPVPIAIDQETLKSVVEAAVRAAVGVSPTPEPTFAPSRKPRAKRVRAVPAISAVPILVPADINPPIAAIEREALPPEPVVVEAAPIAVVETAASAPVANVPPAASDGRAARIAQIAAAVSTTRRAPMVSALQPSPPASRPTPAPIPVSSPPLPAKPFAGREIEKLSMAVAWLRNRSYSIRSASSSPISSGWLVSGYIDPIGPEQVIAIARKEGFEA